jgi:hypothetical protein
MGSWVANAAPVIKPASAISISVAMWSTLRLAWART